MSRYRSTSRLVFLIILASSYSPLLGYSMLNKNDPYPVFSAEYPYDYLSTWQRDYYRGYDEKQYCEGFVLAISPFRQTSDSGRDYKKEKVPLGDLGGRWNMLGLFYPTDNTQSCSTADPCNILPSLGLAIDTTDCTESLDCPTVKPACGNAGVPEDTRCPEIIDPRLSDPKKEVGFFSVPIEYRKYGVRFQADFRLIYGLGVRVQAGAASVTQTTTGFIDETLVSAGTSINTDCSTTSCCLDTSCDCKKLISENIMLQRNLIANKLGISLKDYQCTGAEDVILSVFWQDLYPMNSDCEEWPYFLFVPYFSFETILPTSKIIDQTKLFAIPLGNNGHRGLGFTAGMDFDFVDSVEFGIQAGMTSFNSKSYCKKSIPTNELQSGIFPFKANLNIKPGTNWTFSASVKAHYFVDRFSAYGQYEVVNHGKDEFCDINVLPCSTIKSGISTPSALVDKMRELSEWRAHLFNFSLTYDISPNAILGFFWQAPLSQSNAYRSTTILWSVIFRV